MFAGPGTFGGAAATVGHGVVNDPARKRSWKVDVVVAAADGALLSIGEAKWGVVVGMEHLDRLRRIRELLTAQDRPGAAGARLACYSGAGFTDEVRRAERDGEVVLVDLDRLYSGT